MLLLRFGQLQGSKLGDLQFRGDLGARGAVTGRRRKKIVSFGNFPRSRQNFFRTRVPFSFPQLGERPLEKRKLYSSRDPGRRTAPPLDPASVAWKAESRAGRPSCWGTQWGDCAAPRNGSQARPRPGAPSHPPARTWSAARRRDVAREEAGLAGCPAGGGGGSPTSRSRPGSPGLSFLKGHARCDPG